MYKLLIVDDEPIIRRGICKLVDLESLFISEAYEASNGAEALEILQRENIHILFADVNMPVMDGLTLAKKAKEINPNLKVVIITGYNYFDYAVTAIKAGVDDFVLKPLSRTDVTEILSKQVAKLRKEQQQLDALTSMAAIKNLAGTGEDMVFKNTLVKEMEENYGNSSFSLVELATHVNLSPGYVSTFFKRLFGIPFQDYLTTMRLEHAKILLLTTGLKTYEIAQRVGFEDANYFSTCFKRKYGSSPTQYREIIAGGHHENTKLL